MGSLKTEALPIFNLLLSFRLAETYKSINRKENEFFLKHLTKLSGFLQWRDPDHFFIKLNDRIEKKKLEEFKKELIAIYPDVAPKVFEIMEKDLKEDEPKGTRAPGQSKPKSDQMF